MHDKPEPINQSATDRQTDELLSNLVSADPADAPDIADAIAARLESGLGPGASDAAPSG